ncbi:hypothetical protein [Gimesia aquarii]|uniref:hypothetical protein n=1 Tax=Gimesia aquarii TaxID=2527964 RepID=UPI00119DB328|nr:hypothetical protein [Gimesia aquarii]
MTEQDAIEIASEYAQEQGWTWREPVSCKRHVPWFRTTYYSVYTNSNRRGCNIRISIDEASGTIKSACFLPR